jgi:hypothetical protein
LPTCLFILPICSSEIMTCPFPKNNRNSST